MKSLDIWRKLEISTDNSRIKEYGMNENRKLLNQAKHEAMLAICIETEL